MMSCERNVGRRRRCYETDRLLNESDRPQDADRGGPDLMEDAVVTCAPHTDGLALAHVMAEQGFGSLPVVNQDRKLVGMVSEYDLLQAIIEGRDPRKITAAELITKKKVLSVTEQTALVELANLFQDHYVTRIPVVRDGKLIGLVARRDLVYGYIRALQYWS